MTVGVITVGAKATCGHLSEGSTTVFADGKGITRVNKDKAGGLITGPGSVGVFVEGFKVSLSKDEIKSHGDSPHDAATTAEPSTTVFAT